MKKIITSALLATTLTTSLSADFLGLEAGYAAWAPKITGDIKNSGQNVNFEDDLGFNDHDVNGFAWIYFDHFVPLIPNVKIQQTNYNAITNKALDKTFYYDGNQYFKKEAGITDLKSDITLDQLDLIAYWRILDNWVNLDLGFLVKQINGSIALTQNGKTNVSDFTTNVPMAYIKARFDMPFTGFSIEADYSTVSYSGNSITDMKGGLVYQTPFGLGATVGLRKENITLDDIDGTDGDINIEGAYAGLFYHF